MCLFQLFAVGLLCSFSDCCLTRSESFDVRDHFIQDNAGRTRVFRGFNAVQKGAPWFPSHLLNDSQLDFYQAWGFNAVRLGVMWSGLEPIEGHINASYIKVMQNIVSKLGERGMFVILDMHQDVLSSAFQTYDGIPLWLLEKLPPSPHQFPWPLAPFPQSSWALGYLTQATGRAFQGIYNNEAGTLDCFVKFWEIVVTHFRSFENVLGYELINEPWAGDIFTDPSLLLPAEAGRRNLQPFYDILSRAIRALDNEKLIFYEPVTWGVFLNGQYSGTGFTSVPGGSKQQSKSVLSYHYYCWLLNSPATNSGGLTRDFCDQVLGRAVFRTVQEEVKNLGGGIFLTEFGLCEPDGDPASEGTRECEFVLQQADDNLQSWTYWDSKFFNSNGDPRLEVVRPFSRPYPVAVAGKPMSMSFVIDTGRFNFTFLCDPTINAATEIFIPKLHYPHGITVNVTPPRVAWKFDPARSFLKVEPCARDVIMATLIVSPRAR
ncbi:hypothetical protein CAPTEDRAFT_95004 [Capitella teleta]|uniref:Glycoside hydrolase family 5 domain-containing protein n=1 Tax=Capitella teleta TaxID=283909 RepID=R7VMA9_CAPTE|nr:hypothetical protein CAPTEDRAFT_95004 [Capitella teleta]|eukprot:ELU18520.1 hypothetical protein CAPTEDRAFT_95004 [Capitella teleta]